MSAYLGSGDALLVVDLQNDFCAGGSLVVPGADEIVPLVNDLAAHFEHVILTQDWHPPGHESFASSHAGKAPFETVTAPYGPQILWPDHCVQDTPGAAFHPDLHVPGAELIVRKGFRREIDSYSAFYENDHATPTGLAGYLRERGLTRLFVCGLATDFCVAWTALDARRTGSAVTVLETACRAIDTGGSLVAAKAQMKDAGVVLADVEVG
jgi:nicotinamidase/pyrazinamidase